MTKRPHPAVMPDVLEEHFEELDFLWEQREEILFAPDWVVAELAAHEDRAEAHLEGLRIGGSHSVEIARPFLTGDERGAAAAAAFTLMAVGAPALEDEILDALSGAGPEAVDGIRIALRHCSIERLAPKLAELASERDPSLRAAAADVLAFHRLAPPNGLADLHGVEDPHALSLVYGAIGRFGGPWGPDMLDRGLRHESSRVRRTALETSARVGLPNLAGFCARAATEDAAPPEAVAFLGVVGDAECEAVLQRAMGTPGVASAAIAGIGALGKTRFIPALLDAMADPALALAAGAAFCRITGADDIAADEPLPPPPDLPEDDTEFLDETLPPDPERARELWERAKDRFDEEATWQRGHDVSEAFQAPVFEELTLEVRSGRYLRARAGGDNNAPGFDPESRATEQMRATATSSD